MSLECPTNKDETLTANEKSNAENSDEFDLKHGIKNIHTPKDVPLSGQYKKSFAYYTFRQRLPNTLNTVLKTLEHVKKQNEMPQAQEDLNVVIDHVNRLKLQLENDEQLETFQGNESDKEVWNSFIESLNKDQCTFYKACWLYAECYMYRKLSSYFEATNTLKNYDFFGQQKLQALKLAADVMEEVAKNTKNSENNVQTFTRLLKLNLWGNRCDLSITSGKEVRPTGNLLEVIDILNANILIDDSEKIWNCLQCAAEQKVSNNIIIDFVCDNAGFELFTDLLLAQYLVDKCLADTVRFNIKAIPWYVSDTTVQDVNCTLKYLQEHKSLELNRLGNDWSRYFQDGRFQLATREDFWTSPYEYFRMPDLKPALYKTLQQSTLLIFKGDLNYRKLLGDFNWDFCEKFEVCLRGFRPTNLCALRTVKGDLICDLKPGQADELSKQQSDWMFTGEYGLIQWAAKE